MKDEEEARSLKGYTSSAQPQQTAIYSLGTQLHEERDNPLNFQQENQSRRQSVWMDEKKRRRINCILQDIGHDETTVNVYLQDVQASSVTMH